MYTQDLLLRKNSFQNQMATRTLSQNFNPKGYSSLPRQDSSTKFRRRSVKMKNVRFNEERREGSATQRGGGAGENVTELRFLTDLLRKKQQSIDIRVLEEPQPKRNTQDYEYYDMIVRDLISEIRTRNSKEAVSPQKLLAAKLEKSKLFSPRKERVETSHIRVAPSKQKMVFSLTMSGTDTVYQKKITSYIEFLYKLNFSNGLYVDLSLSRPKVTYKVKVGPGNNGLFVRSLLERRFWVEFTNGNDFQFCWTQSTDCGIHDEQHGSDEKTEYQRTKPPKRTKLLPNANEENLLKIMRKEEIGITNEWYERSGCGTVSCFPTHQIGRVSNHIPLNCIIGAKRILFKVMFWYYRHLNEVDPFLILPKTFSFEHTETSSNLKAFTQQYQHRHHVWIVKPGENTNRGTGIKVVETPELLTILNRQKGKGSQGRPLIVQQYLKPFLYCGRKFDIRHYLLITSCNGYIRGYWYKQGYIRTSSEKYDLDDLSDDMIHLTNDAIQKKGENYGKYEPANKLSYSQFQRYLDTTYPHKHYNFQAQIVDKMREITTDLMRASFQYMDPQRKKHNFELYGLDFFVSSKFKPYLIECNANPCLEINCPILERIIPGAVEHALRIGFDPLFPPPQHYPPAFRYQLCDRVIDKLKYELIFDEKLEGPGIRQRTRACEGKLDLSGIWLRPEEDVFEDEGEELGGQVNLD